MLTGTAKILSANSFELSIPDQAEPTIHYVSDPILNPNSDDATVDSDKPPRVEFTRLDFPSRKPPEYLFNVLIPARGYSGTHRLIRNNAALKSSTSSDKNLHDNEDEDYQESDEENEANLWQCDNPVCTRIRFEQLEAKQARKRKMMRMKKKTTMARQKSSRLNQKEIELDTSMKHPHTNPTPSSLDQSKHVPEQSPAAPLFATDRVNSEISSDPINDSSPAPNTLQQDQFSAQDSLLALSNGGAIQNSTTNYSLISPSNPQNSSTYPLDNFTLFAHVMSAAAEGGGHPNIVHHDITALAANEPIMSMSSYGLSEARALSNAENQRSMYALPSASTTPPMVVISPSSGLDLLSLSSAALAPETLTDLSASMNITSMNHTMQYSNDHLGLSEAPVVVSSSSNDPFPDFPAHTSSYLPHPPSSFQGPVGGIDSLFPITHNLHVSAEYKQSAQTNDTIHQSSSSNLQYADIVQPLAQSSSAVQPTLGAKEKRKRNLSTRKQPREGALNSSSSTAPPSPNIGHSVDGTPTRRQRQRGNQRKQHSASVSSSSASPQLSTAPHTRSTTPSQSQYHDGEEGEEEDQDSALAHKRRMNAEAAKRFRQRKALRTQSLEEYWTSLRETHDRLQAQHSALEAERQAWLARKEELMRRNQDLERQVMELSRNGTTTISGVRRSL